ncbi:MAG: multicopper oxidase domain-containing protein, partial [Nitrospirota bacterium]
MKTSIHSRFILPSLAVFLAVGAWLFAGSLAVAADVETQTGHEAHSVMNHAAMGMIDNSQEPWAQKLKGQTIVENAIEGRPNRAAMVEMQHNRLMEQMARQAQDGKGSNTGLFNGMSTMHQYDGQGYLLASQNAGEPVATSGGRCPSTVPVKKYDISAINVEISLNQWLDFYPGYMYVLTENLEKVRAEEAKNKAARENEKDQFDTGAVTNGIQGDYIQPLVIRGNQGDCVKITLRNALEGGEAVSLHIHGSSMIMSGTGKPATTTNADATVAKGKSADMEWYILPSTQEGGRQFHTYSNDRELTVMGLFGTFVVEPRGSKYLDPLGKGEPTEMASGWQAIIQNGAGPDFREFVIIYHEVGDEAFRPVNKKGDFLPQRDPLTDT